MLAFSLSLSLCVSVCLGLFSLCLSLSRALLSLGRGCQPSLVQCIWWRGMCAVNGELKRGVSSSVRDEMILVMVAVLR